MIDNDTSTKFLNVIDEANEFSVNFIFNKPIQIFGYGIRSANDFPGRDPRKWSIQFKLPKVENSPDTEPQYEIVN